MVTPAVKLGLIMFNRRERLIFVFSALRIMCSELSSIYTSFKSVSSGKPSFFTMRQKRFVSSGVLSRHSAIVFRKGLRLIASTQPGWQLMSAVVRVVRISELKYLFTEDRMFCVVTSQYSATRIIVETRIRESKSPSCSGYATERRRMNLFDRAFTTLRIASCCA